jgi:hypothetical protein
MHLLQIQSRRLTLMNATQAYSNLNFPILEKSKIVRRSECINREHVRIMFAKLFLNTSMLCYRLMASLNDNLLFCIQFKCNSLTSQERSNNV